MRGFTFVRAFEWIRIGSKLRFYRFETKFRVFLDVTVPSVQPKLFFKYLRPESYFRGLPGKFVVCTRDSEVIVNDPIIPRVNGASLITFSVST